MISSEVWGAFAFLNFKTHKVSIFLLIFFFMKEKCLPHLIISLMLQNPALIIHLHPGGDVSYLSVQMNVTPNKNLDLPDLNC